MRATPTIDDTEPTEPAADVVQQLTLRTTAEGQELSGWLRMNLAAGQRTGTLHVAFCPAIRLPARSGSLGRGLPGPDCRIKLAEAMTSMRCKRLEIQGQCTGRRRRKRACVVFAATDCKK